MNNTFLQLTIIITSSIIIYFVGGTWGYNQSQKKMHESFFKCLDLFKKPASCYQLTEFTTWGEYQYKTTK